DLYSTDFVDWRGSTLFRGAQYNHVHHCTFANYGIATPDDHGVVLEVGNEADALDDTCYNLIEYNTLYHGGHHVLGWGGNHNIYRYNYVRNDAFALYDGNYYGNRVLMCAGPDSALHG